MNTHQLKHMSEHELYHCGDVSEQVMSIKIGKWFNRAMFVLIGFFFINTYAWIAYTAGKMSRPVKNVYIFIPNEKRDSIMNWIQFHSMAEVDPDSVRSLFSAKSKTQAK